MANIGGINPTQGPVPVQPASASKVAGGAPAEVQPPDTVEISQQARIAARLAELPEVRTELVARVKAEVIAGTYDTEEKLNAAIERLLDEL